MVSFAQEWFQDISVVMERTDALYQQLIGIGKPDKLTATKRKIYENRGWLRDLAEPHFDEMLERLKVFYLPKALRPGPAFFFPMRDLDNQYRQAQVRPCPDSYLFKPDHKYRRLGTGFTFKGPQWFGNDPATLQQIIDRRKVLIVEGPFDELACKLLMPDCPVLCSLTKGLTEDHVEYLRILGVRKVFLLFDNDMKTKAGDKGATLTKWQVEKKFNSGIVVGIKSCPAADPSDALKSKITATNLRFLLKDL